MQFVRLSKFNLISVFNLTPWLVSVPAYWVDNTSILSAICTLTFTAITVKNINKPTYFGIGFDFIKHLTLNT